MLHKQQLIVQGRFHIPLGIHLAAHGLCLQPNLLITASFDQDRSSTEILQVLQTLFFCRIHQLLQQGIRGLKGNSALT